MRQRGGGVGQKVFFHNEGGRWARVRQKGILYDKGGLGVRQTVFLLLLPTKSVKFVSFFFKSYCQPMRSLFDSSLNKCEMGVG